MLSIDPVVRSSRTWTRPPRASSPARLPTKPAPPVMRYRMKSPLWTVSRERSRPSARPGPGVLGLLAGDELVAGGGADRVKGDSGNDRVRGNAGADSMFGGGGSDRMLAADG